MNNQVHTQIVSFIWSIADDCLRDVYVRGKYRDVILPMTVIRRLDAMLEGTIENVRNTKKLLDEAKVDNQWPALCNAAGQPFCNASPFLLKDLTSRASKQKLKTDFETYSAKYHRTDPCDCHAGYRNDDDGACRPVVSGTWCKTAGCGVGKHDE